MGMPVSTPAMANRPWPSVSIKATRSAARVPASLPRGGLSESPIPRWSTATTWKSRARVGMSSRHAYQGLRPAVHQQQRRPVAPDDRVLAQPTGIDEPVGERVGEPGREVRRAGDRAEAFLGSGRAGSGSGQHRAGTGRRRAGGERRGRGHCGRAAEQGASAMAGRCLSGQGRARRSSWVGVE
jgi:hypothetical protein